METTEKTASFGIPMAKYALYLFAGMLVLGIGVYLYMRSMSDGLKREVERVRRETLEEPTEEELEEKIRDIQKYLLERSLE